MLSSKMFYLVEIVIKFKDLRLKKILSLIISN